MWKPTKRTMIVCFVTAVAGILLHFLYTAFPGYATAFFSPVSESIWEHLKIIFWPYLLASLFLTRGGGKSCRAPWMLSLLLLCGVMLLAGYLYHVVAGGAPGPFNILLYLVLMAAGFLLPGLLWKVSAARWIDVIFWLAALLGAAILLFTFLPPGGALFSDLSWAGAWNVIPY